jgi:RHS repeat-associated protein
MNRIVFPALLALLLGGCRITTTIVGEGTVTSQNGHFNCSTGNAGDCTEDYQATGSETLVAVPAPGWTFVKWTNCNYVSITSCSTSFGQNTAGNVWAIVATFKPIDPPVQAATYTYNALGQRMTKTVGNVTTLFQYDLAGNLIAELNSSGQALRQHIHVGNEPIAQLTRKPDGTLDVQYVHTDHLGTPTLLTNQNGKVVADIEAMPFGESYVDYAVVEYNKRFPGQYKDAESGLHYNYFRDYDSSIGRYRQSDPLGLQGGLNTYAYVNGNPINSIDPLGLYWFRQPEQVPGKVGRANTSVAPGGRVSEFIEKYVPAGYTFGEMHDSYVQMGWDLGYPDWMINKLSMLPMYQIALTTEVMRSMGILDQPAIPTPPTPPEAPVPSPPCR